MEKIQPEQIADLARLISPRLSSTSGPLESMGEAAGTADLSLQAVTERWARSSAFLKQFIQQELGDDPDLVSLAERTLQDGREGLELIGDHRDSAEAPMERIAAGLEVIVETDGSRPAYLVRDDFIVPESSPPGSWTDLLTDVTREDAIRKVLASVGRIDITHPLRPYAGTGWLIAPELVATNRHVAQIFVDFAAEGGPRLRAEMEPRIDFGHEFNGRASVARREITGLVFCGVKPIPAMGIDHSVLDLAVFRVAPAPAGGAQEPLALNIAGHAATPQTEVFVSGYPARPDPASLGSVSETDKVLRLLFAKLWGFKRLAPGIILPPTIGARTMNHDATTLGGNSGSLVMGLDSIPSVTGIHYGGSWAGDRVNWGHVLAAVRDEAGLPGLAYASLADLCAAEGVQVNGA